MTTTKAAPELHKGLVGVVVDTTTVSKIDPDSNSLLYRGYPAQDLATRRSIEEVAYLLWHGELPTADQLAAQTAVERAHRSPRAYVRTLIDGLPPTCHPMDVVRTAVSAIGAYDLTASDASPGATRSKALRLWAALPAVIAYDQRRRHGLTFIEPRDDLPYAENLLWMAFGAEPDPIVARAFSASMVLYADHSFNASTFTARVITSTLSDLYSAVTGAVGALKGPLHGGANEAVMAAFDEIGSADGVADWLDAELDAGRRIMGFGHRVYKNGDSRVPAMRAALGELVEHTGRTDILDLYTALEDAVAERKGIKPNLDYPTGPAYHLMGFDTSTFTPLFAAARVIGWTAHIAEQRADNALIRPVSQWVGSDQREVPEGVEAGD